MTAGLSARPSTTWSNVTSDSTTPTALVSTNRCCASEGNARRNNPTLSSRTRALAMRTLKPDALLAGPQKERFVHATSDHLGEAANAA
jgi:hypothetical protein